ncbi:hypothetical protein STEG23_003350, partial [Scotinomys teguina]
AEISAEPHSHADFGMDSVGLNSGPHVYLNIYTNAIYRLLCLSALFPIGLLITLCVSLCECVFVLINGIRILDVHFSNQEKFGNEFKHMWY